MAMTRAMGFGVAAWIGVAGAGFAQEKPKEKPATPPTIREMIGDLDANGDKVIDKAEVPDSAQPAFAKLLELADTDKDGKLDQVELRAAMRADGPAKEVAKSAEPAMLRFKKMDKDDDGKVTKAEFVGPEAMFGRLDADKDGSIGRDEMRKAGAGNAAEAIAKFRAMDKDGDRMISKTEFTGAPALFDRLDADDDGQLTPQEIRAARGEVGKANPKAEARMKKQAKKAKKAEKAENKAKPEPTEKAEPTEKPKVD